MDQRLPVTGPDLERWYLDHRVELLRLATLALGDRERAEDVVHDVFASLQRRPPTLHPGQPPLPYLRSAVLNRSRTGIRRLVTGRSASERLQRQRRVEPAGPEDAAVAGASRAAVLAAVRRLPLRQRDVVLLRYWLDLSEAEIAATLGVSAGTVKTCAHRAMQSLAPLLEDQR